MPVARTLSFKDKLPGLNNIKTLWNRNSATFHQELAPDSRWKKQNYSFTAITSRNTSSATTTTRPSSRHPGTTARTTHSLTAAGGANHSNHQKKRPRICRIQPTKASDNNNNNNNNNNNQNDDDNLVFLRREDLQLGPIIGEGGFAQVYGLFQCPAKLLPKKQFGKANSLNRRGVGKENGGNPQVPSVFPFTTQRPPLASHHASIMTATSSSLTRTPQYCVKVIRKGLLSNATLFQKAADDLVNESADA